MGACSYGAIPDPAKPASVYVSTADFARWLGATIYGKLAPWVWEQGTQGYEVAALATLNPDTPGPITDLEVTIASSNPVSAMLFASRLKAFGQYMAFAENCLCLGAPGGGPWSHSTVVTINGVDYIENEYLLPAEVRAAIDGARAFDVQFDHAFISGSGTASFYCIWWDASGGRHGVSDNTGCQSQGVTAHHTHVIPAGCVGWSVPGKLCYSGTATLEWTLSTTLPVPPATTPTTAPLPTLVTTPAYPAGTACTTIADVCSKLDQVLSLLSYTKRDVDIIQRQSVPFAYIGGASHAVTGHGQFAVTDLLGLAVTFTAIPARLPVEVGTPDNIWQLGRISLGTADGWQRNITLTHSPALVVPVSGFVTKVGYTLPLGVAATITELKAEP